MYADSDWLCVVGLVYILTEFSANSSKSASLPLLTSSSFSLHVFIHQGHLWPPTPLHHCTTFCDWRKVLICLLFINHSNMFPLWASTLIKAQSTHLLSLLADLAVLLTLTVHSFIHLSSLLLNFTCSPRLEWHSRFVRRRIWTVIE